MFFKKKSRKVKGSRVVSATTRIIEEEEKNKEEDVVTPTPDLQQFPEHCQIAIVGGGIGGMAAAIFLRDKGFDVTVFESHSYDHLEKMTLKGNGIHLYFQCARMLHNAGLPISKYLTPLDIQMRRDDGLLRSDITRPVQLKVAPELEPIKASVYSLLRSNLSKVLLEGVPREIIFCEKSCTRVTENDNDNDDRDGDGDGKSSKSSSSSSVVHFDDGTSVTADLVIGADGINSVIADQLYGKRQLNNHEILVLQGLSSYTDLGDIETWILQRNGGTMGLVPCVLPDGTGGTFWWITLPQTEVDETKSDLECLHDISKRFSWHHVKKVVDTADPNSLGRWHSKDKEPLEEWYKGRSVLLGDACHAASPFSGYGAGMSIEDAFWLAKYLGSADGDVLSNDDLLEEALQKYQMKRAAYTASIVQEARVLMNVCHPTNGFVSALINTAFDTLKIPGPIIAKKFIRVYKQGVSETEWNPEESNAGKLAL